MQSPLIMGGELTDLDDWTKSLLTNSTLLKMDNSISEKFELTRTDQMIVWYAHSDRYAYYGIFNISSKPIMVSQVQLEQIGIENDARDVWHDRQLAAASVQIGSHDVLLTEQLRN